MLPLNKESLIFTEHPLMEYTGGEGWAILHGDTLSLLRSFQHGSFDALITDPPLRFRGSKPCEKTRTTNQKYSSMDKDSALPDFDGDQKDQRSWTRWMAEWLSDARKVCKPGAPHLPVYRLAAVPRHHRRPAVGRVDLARLRRLGQADLPPPEGTISPNRASTSFGAPTAPSPSTAR